MTEQSSAVFLSYASQDNEAARRICQALRAAGIEVWFDQSELRGGEVWDAAIRKHVKTCTLFIPVISRNTHAREEGYFRLEWKLAVDRSHLMTGTRTFLLPVVIDDSRDDDEHVPEKFREVQWTRLPGGEITPAFVERVLRLVSPDTQTQLRSPAAAVTHTALRQPAPFAAASRQTQRVLLLIAAVTVIGVVYVAADRFVLWKRTAIDAQTAISTGQPGTPAQTAISEKSIAVLPFVDMSEKKDQQYFADGIAEELIDLLAQIQDLQVIARTSSFYFKGRQVTIADIANQLRVSHILEGSVRKVGNTVRVTVQLIRADRAVHQWSQTYDRNVKDIFQVQDEIAAAVVGTLKLKLLPAQQILNPYRSSNPDAYNQYLLGREFQKRANGDSDRRAADAFRKAIELDPRYAAAYAGLAGAENTLADFSPDPIAGQKRALAAAEQSVALAPNSAVGYAARGAMRLSYSWDWAGAQADLEKARALDSSDTSVQLGYGSVLATLGKLPAAIAATKRATEWDPLSTRAWQSLGRLLTASHQFLEAREANRRVLEIDPEYPYALNDLGRIQLFEHQGAQALPTFRRVGISELRLMGVAIAEHTLGHAKESQLALDELIAKGATGWAYQIAEVFAWRGQKDKAFEWLDRAYEQHDSGLSDIKVSPTILLSGLPSDPRYSALLRKLNLPE